MATTTNGSTLATGDLIKMARSQLLTLTNQMNPNHDTSNLDSVGITPYTKSSHQKSDQTSNLTSSSRYHESHAETSNPCQQIPSNKYKFSNNSINDNNNNNNNLGTSKKSVSFGIPQNSQISKGHLSSNYNQPLPRNDALKWAQGLDHLLSDEEGVKLFTKFLKAENISDRSLMFVFACRGLKKRNSAAQASLAAAFCESNSSSNNNIANSNNNTNQLVQEANNLRRRRIKAVYHSFLRSSGSTKDPTLPITSECRKRIRDVIIKNTHNPATFNPNSISHVSASTSNSGLITADDDYSEDFSGANPSSSSDYSSNSVNNNNISNIIPSPVSTTCNTAMGSDTVFDEALAQVEAHLAATSYMAFLKSDFYLAKLRGDTFEPPYLNFEISAGFDPLSSQNTHFTPNKSVKSTGLNLAYNDDQGAPQPQQQQQYNPLSYSNLPTLHEDSELDIQSFCSGMAPYPTQSQSFESQMLAQLNSSTTNKSFNSAALPTADGQPRTYNIARPNTINLGNPLRQSKYNTNVMPSAVYLDSGGPASDFAISNSETSGSEIFTDIMMNPALSGNNYNNAGVNKNNYNIYLNNNNNNNMPQQAFTHGQASINKKKYSVNTATNSIKEPTEPNYFDVKDAISPDISNANMSMSQHKKAHHNLPSGDKGSFKNHQYSVNAQAHQSSTKQAIAQERVDIEKLAHKNSTLTDDFLTFIPKMNQPVNTMPPSDPKVFAALLVSKLNSVISERTSEIKLERSIKMMHLNNNNSQNKYGETGDESSQSILDDHVSRVWKDDNSPPPHIPTNSSNMTINSKINHWLLHTQKYSLTSNAGTDHLALPVEYSSQNIAPLASSSSQALPDSLGTRENFRNDSLHPLNLHQQNKLVQPPPPYPDQNNNISNTENGNNNDNNNNTPLKYPTQNLLSSANHHNNVNSQQPYQDANPTSNNYPSYFPLAGGPGHNRILGTNPGPAQAFHHLKRSSSASSGISSLIGAGSNNFLGRNFQHNHHQQLAHAQKHYRGHLISDSVEPIYNVGTEDGGSSGLSQACTNLTVSSSAFSSSVYTGGRLHNPNGPPNNNNKNNAGPTNYYYETSSAFVSEVEEDNNVSHGYEIEKPLPAPHLKKVDEYASKVCLEEPDEDMDDILSKNLDKISADNAYYYAEDGEQNVPELNNNTTSYNDSSYTKGSHKVHSITAHSGSTDSNNDFEANSSITHNKIPITTTTFAPGTGVSKKTVIGYYFCNEPVPYRTKLHGSDITLKQFKSLLSKKGNYRYYFKTTSDEFQAGGVINEEISDDEQVLPLWEGKIFAKVEAID